MTMRAPHGWRPGLACLMLAGLLAGCGGTPARPRIDGEWAGTLVTQQGRCPDHAPSRLIVQDGKVSFIPGGGVLVLTGHHAPGATAVHAQLSLTDMNHKPLPMVFEGAMAPDGSRVDATFGTPACRASLVMLRPTDFGLQRVLGN